MSSKTTKTESLTQTSGIRDRLALFGPPLLLDGEDPAAYDELAGRFWAAVKPVDIIDEMFIADVLCLQWEMLRLRRLKTSMLKARGENELKSFLSEHLDYELYREGFEEVLTETLQEIQTQDQANGVVEKLVRDCADNDQDAVDKVNKVLHAAKMNIDAILKVAHAEKVQELMEAYARSEPAAISQVTEILASKGRTMGDLYAASCDDELLTVLERVDRLIAALETRRNASLKEIDRHREALGWAKRRSVEPIEEGDFEMIAPAGKKSAA